MDSWKDLSADLQHRYGGVPLGFDRASLRLGLAEPPALWRALAERGSIRAFGDPAPTLDELRLIAAVALAAPTKSDLQQRDLILVDDGGQLAALKAIFNEPWSEGSAVLVVACANNHRQRLIHEMRGHPFVNDHLDAFFNASVDAAIVLAAFVLAAEAAGFGACPISAIRNNASRASDILELPQHVFPVAAVAVGRPAEPRQISLRLPLELTVHHNRYVAGDGRNGIDAYDRRRSSLQPYARQRYIDEHGRADYYPWSEDKARQYGKPERADFGAFIRAKGFRLE